MTLPREPGPPPSPTPSLALLPVVAAPRRSLRIEISGRSLLMLLAALGAIWLAVRLWPVLVIILVALLLAGFLHPYAVWLEKRGFRRHLALITVFVAILGLLAGIAILTVPPIITELGGMLENGPALQLRLSRLLDQNWLTSPLAESVRLMKPDVIVRVAGGFLLANTTRLLLLFGSLVTTLFLALYLIAEREIAQGALFAVIPRRFHVRVARILRGLGTIVGGYMRGQIITSVLMAAFTTALLYALQVPNAVGLGILAGMFDVLPFIGALLAITPAVMFALTVSPAVAIIVFIAMVAYQEFETRLLVPRVYARTMRLPASAVIIAILAGGVLMGILGALIALPVAAGIRMIVKELRLDLPGDDTDDTTEKALDRRVERAYAKASAGADPAEAAKIATDLTDRDKR